MKTITVVLIFLLVFTVIKLSGIVAISKLMKPSEKQIEEARQKRLQAEKEGKDPFEDWDERWSCLIRESSSNNKKVWKTFQTFFVD